MAVDAGKQEKQRLKQGYVRRDLDEIDELGNVITDGPLDDTISSRMQRWKIGNVPHPTKFKRLLGRLMCWWLGDIQKDHDIKANAGDLASAEAEEKRTKSTLEKSGAQDIR